MVVETRRQSLPVLNTSLLTELETPGRFALGNRKLGQWLIWHYSLPAISTCPGRTQLCEDLCYADEGFYAFNNVQAALERNRRWSESLSFVDWAVRQIRRQQMRVCRIHVAGDFYSAAYARKWYAIIKRSPSCVFFFYTRSWRQSAIRRVLNQMARDLSGNLQIWFSVDRETGLPRKWPESVQLAYLLANDESEPPAKIRNACRLAFRPYKHIRDFGWIKKFAGQLQVCPVEQRLSESPITCERCRICFRLPSPQ